MENFEKSFEDMDVRSEYVEQTMNSSTTAAMPEGEVDTLMQARTHPTRPATLRPPASYPNPNPNPNPEPNPEPEPEPNPDPGL